MPSAISSHFRLKLGQKKRIMNYLDDFLFIARTLARVNFMIQQFLKLCAELGVPISMDKMEWGQQVIIFLGILLDGKHLVLSVPKEKRDLAISLLEEMMVKKKATVKDLQKLCGYLNFLGKAIFPGRTFTRRMYSKYTQTVNIGGCPKNANEFKLKQHHHVRLDSEFKSDCELWLQFLQEDNQDQIQSAICRPMVDLLLLPGNDIAFYSDASAAKELGFGAILKNRWICSDWTSQFIAANDPSIEFLELYALCMVC